MPELALDDRAQDDLELALAGVGGGRFMTAYAGEVGAGEVVRLVDAEGAPLADLHADGTVTAVAERVARPFEELYRALPAAGAAGRVTVPVDAALSEAALGGIVEEARGREVVLAALVGAGSPRGCSAVELIRASVVAQEMLVEKGLHARVVAIPLSREHGIAQDQNALSETASDDSSRESRWRTTPALIPALQAYAPGELYWPPEGGVVPEGIAAAVRSQRSPGQGIVILFSGLSGSGKSTIARGVRNALIEGGARAVTLLDGDVVRRHLSAGLGFSRADRETNVARIGWVAAEIARHGGIALASPIAPFAATRAEVREMVEAAGGVFVLVHVATPLEECERRDRKGLYARARAGEIADFTGISSPYEEPEDAELVVDTTGVSVGEAVEAVLGLAALRGTAALRARGSDEGAPAALRARGVARG